VESEYTNVRVDTAAASHAVREHLRERR
jgi:hypothetical protein